MKSLTVCSMLSTSLLSLALSASPASAAVVRPAGEAEVSTVEGHPIPVGEKNRYLTSYRTWNVSTNPLGFIWGSYGASVSYALGSHFALRADANYYQPVGGDSRGFEGGVGVPIYFGKVYQGLFLEPGFVARRVRENVQESGPNQASLVRKDVGPQMLVGYQWMWDSGFNVALAAGIGRNFSTNDRDDELFANGYLRVGYAF